MIYLWMKFYGEISLFFFRSDGLTLLWFSMGCSYIWLGPCRLAVFSISLALAQVVHALQLGAIDIALPSRATLQRGQDRPWRVSLRGMKGRAVEFESARGAGKGCKDSVGKGRMNCCWVDGVYIASLSVAPFLIRTRIIINKMTRIFTSTLIKMTQTMCLNYPA